MIIQKTRNFRFFYEMQNQKQFRKKKSKKISKKTEFILNSIFVLFSHATQHIRNFD